jgi:hypothetical protein
LKYFDNIPLLPGHMPPDVASEEEERYFGPPDQHDVGDDEEMATALWAHREQVRRLERFIQEFDDLASMDGQDILAVLCHLFQQK